MMPPMMPPFIEAGGEVHVVIGWDPDGTEGDSVTLRKLDKQEVQRYRRLRWEADVELYVNFNSGE